VSDAVWSKASAPHGRRRSSSGHDLNRNIALNFAATVRRDLGLPPLAHPLPHV
jgi:hypothetical protein